MPTRPYLFYGLTNSICSQCLVKVEAKIIFRDEAVYLVKHCLTHGREEVPIADDIEYYKLCQDFIKPGDMPVILIRRSSVVARMTADCAQIASSIVV
nr:hypothetical protein [Chamaesiphon sp. GL140_3_metabinner_50]